MLRRATTCDTLPASGRRPSRWSRGAPIPLGLSLVLTLVAVGLSSARPATLGEAFVLCVGETSEIGADRLKLGFTGVRSDSRCPEGVECFWQGDAVVALDVRIAGAPAESIELHTAGGSRWPRDARVDAFLVQLVQLAPGNRLGGVRADEYRLTLRVTRASDH